MRPGAGEPRLPWHHFKTMRVLLCLCLASGLLAGGTPRPEAPEPGRDAAFLARIMGDDGDGIRPWRTFRPPAESASAVVEVFIRSEDLAGWIPRPVLLQVAAGGLLGMFFPVCECGVVPLTRRLIWKGMPPGAAVAFLLGALVLNPIVIASTYAAFGTGPVLWGRLGLTFLVATGTGLIFRLCRMAGRCCASQRLCRMENPGWLQWRQMAPCRSKNRCRRACAGCW